MRAPGGRWWLAVAVLLALVASGATAVALRQPHAAGPSVAAPPPEPDPTRTPLLASAAGAVTPTGAGLQRALAGALADPAVGRRVVLSVLDVATGAPLLERSATAGAVPASTAKITTAVAALSVLPADRRFTTRVVAGAVPGEVVLVGGGDPLLAGAHPLSGRFPRVARLSELAAQLRGTPVRRLLVDDSLFTGPRTGPGWKPTYVTGGDVAPVSALAVDGGRLRSGLHAGRADDPALQAGRELAGLLKVRAAVTRGRAVAGATELARVQSPPVPELVEAMLGRSDNDVAEALGRQVALERGLPATFDGEVRAVGEAVRSLVPAAALALRDASGLSPLDRIAPGGLTRLLAAAAPDVRFAALLSGLPVAGFDGTLQDRYRSGPAAAAAGVVRAKTGTLVGVNALAGLVRTRDGRLLAFDLVADGVSGTRASQGALDRVAAVLASCGCA